LTSMHVKKKEASFFIGALACENFPKQGGGYGGGELIKRERLCTKEGIAIGIDEEEPYKKDECEQ
jgi:hypothetical protein